MPRLAANLSTLFQEIEFLDRFEAAAKAGFKGVELHFPYAIRPERIRKRLDDFGLELVAFDSPPGDWNAGERGMAALHGREDEFKRSIGRAVEYAEATRCTRLHVMAGVANDPEGMEHSLEHYVDSLRYAAGFCGDRGIAVMIEPMNAIDVPDYFLSRPLQALDLLEAIRNRNLFLQYDVYDAQTMEGDLTTTISANIDIIKHIQIGGVPERHEPDRGEVNYPYLFEVLDQIGYDGWVGCDYKPRAGTLEGLGWAKPYGIG
jgi:hydroxypyruvate isomerase